MASLPASVPQRDGASSCVAPVQSRKGGAEMRWDQFVDRCADATFFHLAGWKKVIEQSFGHDCHFIYAESSGQIRGVLPLVHMRSRIFGNSMVSNAFCVYGGPVAADREAIAVACNNPDVEIRVCELEPGRDRRRPSVDRVETVGFDVIRETRGAPDARDEHGRLRTGADISQCLGHGLQYRVVAASRAPAHFLGGGEIPFHLVEKRMKETLNEDR